MDVVECQRGSSVYVCGKKGRLFSSHAELFEETRSNLWIASVHFAFQASDLAFGLLICCSLLRKW